VKTVKIIVATIVVLAIFGSCALGVRSYIDVKHQIDVMVREQSDRYGSIGR